LPAGTDRHALAGIDIDVINGPKRTAELATPERTETAAGWLRHCINDPNGRNAG